MAEEVSPRDIMETQTRLIMLLRTWHGIDITV